MRTAFEPFLRCKFGYHGLLALVFESFAGLLYNIVIDVQSNVLKQLPALIVWQMQKRNERFPVVLLIIKNDEMRIAPRDHKSTDCVGFKGR